MLSLFKKLAIAEGYSFLLILFITMPLKYLAGMGFANQVVGMAHGFLFIAYVALAILVGQLHKWNFKKTIVILLMSIVPFGTFWMEREYLDNAA